MFRDDTLGVTSVIRTLLLAPGCYETMLHFFYSRAWNLDSLREIWFSIVVSSGLIQQVDGKYVLVGDGVKTSKEAYHMPGVKKLFQELEDSSKGEYIFGHMFGAVGAIIAKGSDAFCVPLWMSIQEGLRAAAAWEGSTVSAESHVQQMVRNGFQVADRIGSCILVLDRLFLTSQAICMQGELNSARNGCSLEIVTKAKRGCTAYTKPPARQRGMRGGLHGRKGIPSTYGICLLTHPPSRQLRQLYMVRPNRSNTCARIFFGGKSYTASCVLFWFHMTIHRLSLSVLT